MESRTRGVLTRLTLIEELVNTSGTLRDARHDAVVPMAWSKACSDIPIFGGEYDEYEDWQYKVRIFLNSECSQCLQDSSRSWSAWTEKLIWRTSKATQRSEDLPGRPADLFTWTNQQLFNVLAQTTRGTSLPDGEEFCQKKKGVAVLELGSHSCVHTRARMQAEVRDSLSEFMTSKRVSSYSEVLARRDMWEATLEEHDLDTGCEVADITMANCLRRLVDPCLSADFLKMSHTVRCCNVKKNIIDQVGLRLCHDQERPKGEPNGVKPLDTSFAAQSHDDETGETLAKLRAKV